MMHLLRRVFYRFSPLQWQWGAACLLGRREENQDNFLCISPGGETVYMQGETRRATTISSWDSDFYRIAVADGMGGHLYGREVAEELMQALLILPAQTHLNPATLRGHLYAIHKQLFDKYPSEHRKPGTTLVLADINQRTGQVLLANVGDSRAYVWEKGQSAPQLLTYDHTNREFDWREAVAQAPDTPEPEVEKSNTVAQTMGFGSYGLMVRDGYRPRQLSAHIRLDLAEELPQIARHHADIFSFELDRGDTLLLATDGLWSGDGNDAAYGLAPDTNSSGLQQYAEALAETAYDNGSKDNITAIALTCH